RLPRRDPRVRAFGLSAYPFTDDGGGCRRRHRSRRRDSRNASPLTIKRAVDVVLAVIAVIVTSPIWLVASLVVKLSSKGPVFHRAVRAGKDGVPFKLLKFRTM